MTWGYWLVNRRAVSLVVLAPIIVGALWLDVSGIANGAAKVILGILFVLLLPGYSLTVMVFSANTLGEPERVVFSLGLSLAVVAIGGLVLNLTPLGLQPLSWAVLLGSISLGASGLALRRQRRSTVEEAEAIPSKFKINLKQFVLFGLAALVTVGAIWVAGAGESHYKYPGFTQLWILPANDVSRNAFRLGVSSHEPAVVKYRLQVKVGENIILEWGSIELEAGDSWETMETIPAELADTGKVEAILYRLESPNEVYRRVTLLRSERDK
jgi:uncharacterized membrane protein